MAIKFDSKPAIDSPAANMVRNNKEFQKLRTWLQSVEIREGAAAILDVHAAQSDMPAQVQPFVQYLYLEARNLVLRYRGERQYEVTRLGVTAVEVRCTAE